MLDNEGVLVTEVLDCPLCGHAGSVLHRNLRDRFYDAPGVWSFMKCTECGHVWLDPCPLPGQVRKLYPAGYNQPAATSTLSPSRRWMHGVARRSLLWALGYTSVTNRRTEKLLGPVLLRFPPIGAQMQSAVMYLHGTNVGTLLDVGCGRGIFLAQMRSLGWIVTGLEPDDYAARDAQERYGIPVFRGNAEDMDFPPGTFDAITMNNVIEHVYDPVDVLERCQRWLKRGGVLIIKTPSLESLGHLVFQDSWMHLDPPRHLHLFSGMNLEECIERVGMRAQTVITSAAGAVQAEIVSREIRTTGRSNLQEARQRSTFPARLFWAHEVCLRAVNHGAGEELVVIAKKI